MNKLQIRYREGYKCQLAELYSMATPIKPAGKLHTRFMSLTSDGFLEIQPGYAWDGVSGGVPDTTHNMRASLVHDAFYQLMRLRMLSSTKWRRTADRLFSRMCREDGTWRAVAFVYYVALRRAGASAADPESSRQIITAPEDRHGDDD